MDHLVKEATEISLLLNNFNRKERFKLSKTWISIIRFLQLSDADRENPG
jgi:hypothetical protein